MSSIQYTTPLFQFLGATFFHMVPEKIIERREFDNSSVSIGLLDGEWHYCVTPGEAELGPMDIERIESKIKRLPETLSIDVQDLLREQRLAKELLQANFLNDCNDLDFSHDAVFPRIISKYCIGLGVIEDLLADELVEDIIISSPCSENRVHVATRLSDVSLGSVYCKTNLVLSSELLRAMVNRICIFGNKELTLNSPVVETDIPYLNARVSAVDYPVSPQGLSVAIRRRSSGLWTLARLISLGSISWTVAGFLSLCCAAKASIIVAGGRGSGKTTLLSALIPELPSTGRIIIMEDTQELPVPEFQKEGFSIQRLSIDGDFHKSSSVMRAALRMGEGPIVVGEIRGAEAKILFESIRTGTASSTVIGTLHASDTDSFQSRLIFDMGIDREALDAVEVIVFVNHRKDPNTGGYSRFVSEICAFDGKSGEFDLRPIFKFDESGLSLKPEFGLEDVGRIQAKFSSYLGIGQEDLLKASRLRGFIRLLQSNEYLRRSDDRIVSVSMTRILNKISIHEMMTLGLEELKARVLSIVNREVGDWH